MTTFAAHKEMFQVSCLGRSAIAGSSFRMTQGARM